MIAFLSKSGASARFDQIMDFLNTQVIHYALMVNPTIYVSCIKQLWVTTSIKKVNDVIKLQALIDRKKVVVTEDIIRQDLQLDDPYVLRGLPEMNLVVPWPRLSSALLQVERLIFLITSLTAWRRIGKGFLGVETLLFATMLAQPQAATEEEDEEDEVHAAPTPPSPTHKPSPPPQEPITSPPQAQPAPPSSLPQEQPTDTYMTLLHTLMETCVTLSKKLLLTHQNLPFGWCRLINE
nr:hypothetical protein [Tanacetum cinerariifolium]